MYCGQLDKELLEAVGFTKVYQDGETWVFERYWYDGNSKKKSTKNIKISPATKHHKYRPDKEYPKVTFSARGFEPSHFSITISRFLYAWFKGPIPQGMVIDHINNNPYDNSLDNLALSTIPDNLAKRFSDNPESWTNQYGKTKGWKNNE